MNHNSRTNTLNDNELFFCNLIRNVIHPEYDCEWNEKVDWNEVVQLAKDHNLFPVFMEGAVKHPSYKKRVEYAMEMEEAYANIIAQVQRTTAFVKLYNEFVSNDCYPIVLKGIVCRELYGKLSDHRFSSDEDILIEPKEYEKAKKILNSQGYYTECDVDSNSKLEWMQEVSFYNQSENLIIELHVNTMGYQNDINSHISNYFKKAMNDTLELNIQGTNIRAFNHTDNMLYLILHAFKHFIGGGFGVRQVLDILFYYKKYQNTINEGQLKLQLGHFRAAPFFNDLLCIGNDYFGFHFTTEESQCYEELLEDILDRGVFGNKTQAEAIAGRATMVMAGNYLNENSSKGRTSFIQVLFPSKTYMMKHSPFLDEKPWLLPVEWIKRWFRFILKNFKSDRKLTEDSLQLSKKRIELMKKYDLI